MMDYTFEQYQASADTIRSRLGGFVPEVALVLGSGLGFLGDVVENAIAVPYGDIPHFKASTAPGHQGRLVFGTLAGRPVAVMQGRMHHYEGYTYEETAYAMLRSLVGSEMCIRDRSCIVQATTRTKRTRSVSYTHLTLPTTPYV